MEDISQSSCVSLFYRLPALMTAVWIWFLVSTRYTWYFKIKQLKFIRRCCQRVLIFDPFLTHIQIHDLGIRIQNAFRCGCPFGLYHSSGRFSFGIGTSCASICFNGCVFNSSFLKSWKMALVRFHFGLDFVGTSTKQGCFAHQVGLNQQKQLRCLRKDHYNYWGGSVTFLHFPSMQEYARLFYFLFFNF